MASATGYQKLNNEQSNHYNEFSAFQAFSKYNVELVTQLPMSDATFIAHLQNKDLLSGNEYSTLNAKETEKDRAGYFLQEVVNRNIDKNLIKLLYAMESYGSTVAELANTIRQSLKTAEAPTFSTPPSPQSVDLGQDATFTCSATGDDVKYEWKIELGSFEGNVNGTNTDTLTIKKVKSSNNKKYFCTISNDGGSTKSDSVQLTVTGLPKVSVNPHSQTVHPGHLVEFTAVAEGLGKDNFIYRWNHNGKELEEKSKSLKLSSVTKENEGSYECYVENQYSDNATDKAELKVKSSQLTSTIHPSHQNKILTSDIDKLSLSCHVEGATTYAWKKVGDAIPIGATGADTDTLHLSNLTPAHAGNYQCVVNGNNPSQSATVNITVAEPEVTQQPTPQSVSQSKTATFYCCATGYNVNYEWKKGSGNFQNNVTGINSSELVISDVQPSDEDTYTCKISNEGGEVETEQTKLTVNGKSRWLPYASEVSDMAKNLQIDDKCKAWITLSFGVLFFALVIIVGVVLAST